MRREVTQMQSGNTQSTGPLQQWALPIALLGLLAMCLVGCQRDGRSIEFFSPVTVAEIQHQSKEKVPADVIIKKIYASGTIYHLNDRQTTNLEADGVSPKVIAYMKKTYTDAVKKYPYLAKDYNFTCWYMGYDGFWYGPSTKPFSSCGQ
mgnify:FL=1